MTESLGWPHGALEAVAHDPHSTHAPLEPEKFQTRSEAPLVAMVEVEEEEAPVEEETETENAVPCCGVPKSNWELAAASNPST